MNFRTAAGVVIALGGIALAAWAASTAGSPWQGWKILHLRATSIPFFSGKVEMRLSTTFREIAI